MDFSEALKFSGICEFSPNGKFLASSAGYRLTIREVESLHITTLYTCVDAISRIEWSSDSKYILCCLSGRSSVQVWSVEDEKWRCRIDEGPAGISHVQFSPDGRHVLTTAQFQLRMTIWSLVNGSVAFIKYPKFASHGIDFTRDGKYMALAERHDGKDSISVFTTETWELVKHFSVETKDLSDLKWSADGRQICVWDSLLEYKILFYTPDGRLLHSYSAYENALGIKTVRWVPPSFPSAASELIAIGSYDSIARIMNTMTFKLLAEYTHPTTLTNSKLHIFKESADQIDSDQSRSKYILLSPPVSIHTTRPSSDKPFPKMGIGMMDWSADMRYLYTRNDNMPTTLWIWETSRLSLLAVIIQISPIRCAQWDPVHPRLAIGTGTNNIYIWTPDGCSCIDVPSTGFQVHSLKWSKDGNALVLMDRNSFCCCYPRMN